MPGRGEVTVAVDGDEIVVTSSSLRSDRVARIFFVSVLGGREFEGGWRCPRRRQSVVGLVVRINTFLESKGWVVNRVGAADEAVQRAIERKRSFQRTKESANIFR